MCRRRCSFRRFCRRIEPAARLPAPIPCIPALPALALRVLLSVAEQQAEQNPGNAMSDLTVIDTPPAIKAMTETVRAIERSLGH